MVVLIDQTMPTLELILATVVDQWDKLATRWSRRRAKILKRRAYKPRHSEGNGRVRRTARVDWTPKHKRSASRPSADAGTATATQERAIGRASVPAPRRLRGDLTRTTLHANPFWYRDDTDFPNGK